MKIKSGSVGEALVLLSVILAVGVWSICEA